MTHLALLQPRLGPLPQFLNQTPGGMTCAVWHEEALETHEPTGASILLVPGHTDQRLFARHTDWLKAFLGNHGVLVFNGLLAYPFLSELRPFQPLPSRGLQDLRVEVVSDHPVYQGIHNDDLTFRRGVAGFYGRGMNPPPAHADTLVTVGGTWALDWLWRPPGGGSLLMHAGNDIWMHHADTTSAARLAPQLLRWCKEEAEHHAN
jgi:hypothetical protein